MASALANIRKMLWDANKSCFWCGRETTWFNEPTFPPPEAATIDHLYTKEDPRRIIAPHALVLSCTKCNSVRGYKTHGDELMGQSTPNLIFFKDTEKPIDEKPQEIPILKRRGRRTLFKLILWKLVFHISV